MNIYDEIDNCIHMLDEDYMKNLPIVLIKLLTITEKINSPYHWLWVRLQTHELKSKYEPEMMQKFTELCHSIGLTNPDRIKEKDFEITRDFMKHRTFEIGKDQIYGDSVANLILTIQSLEQEINTMKLPETMHPVDLYFENKKQSNLKLTYREALSNYKTILNHIYTRTYQILTELKYLNFQNQTPYSSAEAISKIETIFNKFHSISQQLLIRHSNRETLHIKDEYDVQDLLHSLLLIYFDDVRSEETVPSHAGASSRLDFLIPQYEIGIEAKMTRNGLADRKIGEELLIDIGRYTKHPKCKNLLCFIYDPEYNIENFTGLKADLESHSSETFNIRVYISR